MGVRTATTPDAKPPGQAPRMLPTIRPATRPMTTRWTRTRSGHTKSYRFLADFRRATGRVARAGAAFFTLFFAAVLACEAARAGLAGTRTFFAGADAFLAGAAV